MVSKHTTLHLFAGLIGSGKSTLAAAIAADRDAVLLSEDVWLSALFGPEMQTIADYVQFSTRLRGVLGPHVLALLQQGQSVVLDFPANTRDSRQWMRSLIDTSGCADVLHVLETDEATCRARMHQRNASGDHPFQPSDAQFDAMTRHYQPPEADEGFTLYHHPGA